MSGPLTRFTEGPWAWSTFGNGRVHLGTPDRGHLIVMDFVRAGMQAAEPRFAVMQDDGPRLRRGGIMHCASSLLLDDRLKHPDALVIEAAPLLLSALLAFQTNGFTQANQDRAERAIAQALGVAP